MKILIVDDNEDNRVLQETVLKAKGYIVEGANNGNQALEVMARFCPDMIISDILMPEMDGFELCRVVKADKRLRKIPFVFYSASYTGSKDKELAMALGASRYIVKPVEMEEFVKIIEEILKEHEDGKLPTPELPKLDEIELERMHGKILVNKLCEKVKELEEEITRRKEVEVGIRKLSQAVEQSPSMVVITDTKGRIEYVNPSFSRITGYTVEEVVGKNPRLLKSGKTSPGKYKKLWESITSGREWRGELYNRKKNGELTWESISITPIRNTEGMITNFLKVSEDITERKRIEEKLRVSHKMASLGRLTAGVFHEILNPLNIISSHIQLLLMEAEKGSKTEEDLKSVQEEITRIVKITDGLLRFARKGEYITKEVEVNSLVERILSIVEPDMKLENVRFIRSFDEGLPEIMANSDELRQVFLNLITNAKDAMPAGGTITIRTQRILMEGKSFISIRFMDTGCGISKESQEKIFDPFFTTKKEGEGVGLGLSTSFAIIEHHGGIMSVESQVGKGTTFTIDLPC